MKRCHIEGHFADCPGPGSEEHRREILAALGLEPAQTATGKRCDDLIVAITDRAHIRATPPPVTERSSMIESGRGYLLRE